MATYVKGDAVANATSYELFEKISAGVSLGDEVEQLADWQTSTGKFSNTNYFSQKNRWENTVHVSKFCYYNGGSETITAKLLIYDATTLTITKAFTFTDVAVGANTFDTDFDIEPSEDWIVQVSKDSYYRSTPSGYAGVTIVTISGGSDVGGTVKLGSAFANYTLPANLIGNEYVETSEETYNPVITANAINFDVSDIVADGGTHTFVVQAKGDGANYLDSDYSNEVTYPVS